MKDFISSIWNETTTTVKVIFLVIMFGTIITAVVSETYKLLSLNYDTLTIVISGILDAIGTGIAVMIFTVTFAILYIAIKE